MNQGILRDQLDLTDLLEISDLLIRNDAFSFPVIGWSMYPSLRKGDRLTVEPVNVAQLQIGDLLLFHHRFPSGRRLVCHRLVSIGPTGAVPRLITKGDAVAGCDAPIGPEQVLGKVVAVERSLPWRGSRPWLDRLVMRIDGVKDRATHTLVRVLGYFQSLRSYRWIMRRLSSRFFTYYVGMREGKRFYRYQQIRRGRGSVPLAGHHGGHDVHLLAKLAGRWVGGLELLARPGGYRLSSLFVRMRYRGLGVASQLLALASEVAATSRMLPPAGSLRKRASRPSPSVPAWHSS